MIDTADMITILIAFGLFMLGAGMLGFVGGWMAHSSQPVPLSRWQDDDEDDEEETVEAEVVEEAATLPIDPDNPPFPRVYRQRLGRPSRYCHCHGRQLVDGEVVLFWPNPDIDGAFWLVCAPEGTTA